MRIKLLPTQSEVSETLRTSEPEAITIINYVGGLGSGKTFVGALMCAAYIASYPNSKICMIGPTLNLVRDNTFLQCVRFLNNMGISVDSINKEKTMYMTSNGCSIMITHGQTYKQLLTYEFNYIDVEEASQISNSVLKQVQGRLRYRRPDAPLILITHTNPPGSTNHFTLKSGKLFIASSLENIHLPKGYIENLSKNMTHEEKEKFINSKISPSLDDALIPNYDPLKVKKPNGVEDRIEEIFITCDFNYSPQCWYSGYKTQDGRFLFETEHLNLRSNTENQAETVLGYLIDKYPGLQKLIVYGDSAGAFNQRLDNDYLVIDTVATKFGLDTELRVLPGNPRVAKRLSIFKRCIETDKYKFNLDEMRKTDYVFENTRLDLNSGKVLIATKQELEIDPDLIYCPHAVDAISYLMYYEEHTKDY